MKQHCRVSRDQRFARAQPRQPRVVAMRNTKLGDAAGERRAQSGEV
ncbi:hypothetical protein BURCENBC7_AP1187, partial [Burkholderia cenocepacia BC7]